MSSLESLLSFLLIAAAALLIQPSLLGQSSEAKLKGTGSISGHVTVGGKPAASIAIAAFTIDNGNRRVPSAQATTDHEGYYRLNGLGPGQYQVATLAPNLPSMEAGDPSYGFFYGSSKGILLAAGEQVDDIDLKLARGAVITGRVTDADNKPVVEERVTLQVISDNRKPPVRVPYFSYVTQMNMTDDRGIYRIYGLPAGRYKVSVGAAAGEGTVGSGRGYFQRTYHPDATDPSRANIIDLDEGSEASNIDIHVGRREETFRVSGYVVDETGVPVTGARVGFMVAPKDRDRFSPFVGLPTTDGTFKLDGIAPGRYAAYVSSEYGGGDVYSDPVYFDIVDKDVTGLEIRAVHGLSLSGMIVSENQSLKDLLAQLPGLKVSVNVSPASGRSDDPALRSGGQATVMPDGSFQINGLRTGRAVIGVYTADGSKRPGIVSIDHGGVGITQGFEIQPGQSVSGLRVVIVYGTGIIRGTVKFEGGTPPEGVRSFVSCSREGSRMSVGGAQLDARGHFIIRGLAPGTYEVTLQAFSPPTAPGQRPRPPQKQIVIVINEVEAEVNFVVDLSQKAGEP